MKELTPAQKRKKKLDIFVGLTFGYIAVFVVTAWVAYFVTGAVPDTLVQLDLQLRRHRGNQPQQVLFAIKFRSCWIDDPIDPITRQIITEREAAPW